ncbi:calcium-binding protein [Streptomyces kebangsaanensis]|uniref:Calcium-binding protein n=1 Tax=Streptomyces kebangsaanensis TaxID=864058 RepID=A0ABW6KWZ2_9ACTN
MAGELSDAELDELVEQATVDAYDDEEQLTGLYTMLSEHLAVPFKTVVLGVEVTVKKVDLLPGSQIVAVCTRGRHRQAIGILDLPLPDPAPEGANGVSPARAKPRAWGRIEAYRYWGP